MASKLAVYDTGYEDERFEHVVSQSFHCIICTNVFKDPVMCRHNEHLFCRACITIHLMNTQTCPTCMEPLTVETLTQAPRSIRNLLAELKIRCEYSHRGCRNFIELGDLERHVADCGFAPAVCSNEGCQLEVNKQDLLHHETAVCELRRVECREVQCHNCDEIKQEIDIMKANLAEVHSNLEKKMERNENNLNAMEQNLVAKVEVVQEQLNKQQLDICCVQGDVVEIKECLNHITKQLEKITQEASHDDLAEEMKKGIAEGRDVDREPKVVIVGGANISRPEMFNPLTGSWTALQPLRKNCRGTSLVVYNDYIYALGGAHALHTIDSVEKLSLNAIQTNPSIRWEMCTFNLPETSEGHCSVVHNGKLILIGGYSTECHSEGVCISRIFEISLAPPYVRKVLATMPQRRCYHGVAIFDDKIVIVGGKEGFYCKSALKSIIMYNISKNMFTKLAALPYAVCEMATVKWGDDNIIIMGGFDQNGKVLNKVLLYNVTSQKSHMLPNMKYARAACFAVVVRDTVIVMGDRDGQKTVKCFRFDQYAWKELSEMPENRSWLSAIVC